MDLILNVDDWWEQLIMAWVIGFFPAWLVAYRYNTRWEIRGEALVRRYRNYDGELETFWCSVFWPLVFPVIGLLCLYSMLENSSLINGKPPKELVAQVNEKKLEKALEPLEIE